MVPCPPNGYAYRSMMPPPPPRPPMRPLMFQPHSARLPIGSNWDMQQFVSTFRDFSIATSATGGGTDHQASVNHNGESYDKRDYYRSIAQQFHYLAGRRSSRDEVQSDLSVLIGNYVEYGDNLAKILQSATPA